MQDKERIKRIIASSERLNGLWANPDFQYWKKEIVNKRLKDINKKILRQKSTTEQEKLELQHLLIRYQEMQIICDDVFKISQLNAEKYREQLNAIKK